MGMNSNLTHTKVKAQKEKETPVFDQHTGS